MAGLDYDIILSDTVAERTLPAEIAEQCRSDLHEIKYKNIEYNCNLVVGLGRGAWGGLRKRQTEGALGTPVARWD